MAGGQKREKDSITRGISEEGSRWLLEVPERKERRLKRRKVVKGDEKKDLKNGVGKMGEGEDDTFQKENKSAAGSFRY